MRHAPNSNFRFHVKCNTRRSQGQPCTPEKTHSIITMQEHMFVHHMDPSETNCLAEWVCSCGIKFLSRVFMMEHAIHTHNSKNHHYITWNAFDPNVGIPPKHIEAAKKMMSLMRNKVVLPCSDGTHQVAPSLSNKPADHQGHDANPNTFYNDPIRYHSTPSVPQEDNRMNIVENIMAPHPYRRVGGVSTRMNALMDPPIFNTRPHNADLSPPRRAQVSPAPRKAPATPGPDEYDPRTPSLAYNDTSCRSPGLTANQDSDSDEWDHDSPKGPVEQPAPIQPKMTGPVPIRMGPVGFRNTQSSGLDGNLPNQVRQSDIVNIPPLASTLPPSGGQRQMQQDPSISVENRKRRATGQSELPQAKPRVEVVSAVSSDEADAPPMNQRGSATAQKRLYAQEALQGRERKTCGGRYVGQNPQPLVKMLDMHSLGEMGANMYQERELGKCRPAARPRPATPNPSRSRRSKAEEMARERERSRSRSRSRAGSRAASPSAAEINERSPEPEMMIFGKKKGRRSNP